MPVMSTVSLYTPVYPLIYNITKVNILTFLLFMVSPYSYCTLQASALSPWKKVKLYQKKGIFLSYYPVGKDNHSETHTRTVLFCTALN